MTQSDTIGIELNGERCELLRTSVAGLVASLGLRPEVVAVEVNRTLVPRAERERRELASGDKVEVVTLVGGG
jgi:thiamine biosynthesis protein ThiS